MTRCVSLTEQIRSCTRCPELVAGRRTVVVGDLPDPARLVVMGEAPGALEDETGRPFVGRSGQLLDRLLADVGLPRAQVAVLNTVKCRPPGNRMPTRVETANCRPWTLAQLDLLQPTLVVTLGLTSARWFLGATTVTTLSMVRGRVHVVDGQRVLPTYHPAAALRGGPAGEPMCKLREDLAFAAGLIT